MITRKNKNGGSVHSLLKKNMETLTPKEETDLNIILKKLSFGLCLKKIYVSKDAKRLSEAINAVIVEEGKKNEASVGRWTNLFVEIHTWFQFKELFDKKLLLFYRQATGSDDLSMPKVREFVEFVAKKVMLQHREEEIRDFMTNKLVPLFSLFQQRILLMKTRGIKIDDKALKDNEAQSARLVRGVLERYTYYATEPTEITDKRSVLIVICLFECIDTLTKEITEAISYVLSLDTEKEMDEMREIIETKNKNKKELDRIMSEMENVFSIPAEGQHK
jgi:hypothetical protein